MHFVYGLMVGVFIGGWAIYFARSWVWGFDPDEVSRERGLRR